MILKPVPLTTRWGMKQELTMREGWIVRWDGQHFETNTPPPLKPLSRR